MLSRAGSTPQRVRALRAELEEVCEIAQTTLDKVRSLSQALHPVMLDEAGLENTLDWYIPVVERQTGINISYEKSGTAFPVEGSAAVHIYRVVQEALNNVTRHSGAKQAWVRLRFLPRRAGSWKWRTTVRDLSRNRQSKGLAWWRCGSVRSYWAARSNFSQPAEGGTLVHLTVPKQDVDSHAG